MFGILLLVLLALFYAGSGSSAPIPPPPYAPPKEEEKIPKIIIIVIIVVVILVILIPVILAMYLYVWVGGMMGPTAQMTPTATLSLPTKQVVDGTYYYNMSVRSISTVINPNDVRVRIPYESVILADARNNYAYVTSNIYFKWIDTDMNNRLSTGDVLSIKATDSLGGEGFYLIYIPTGGTIYYTILPYS
ncbi:MAG: hypothetical protein AB1485_03300 [Candidatus Thermoplasmatota archaeon]